MKYKFLWCLHLLHFTFSSQVYSQQQRAINIQYTNDFFTGTDKYFTQGIRIELINPVFKYSPVRSLSYHDQSVISIYSFAIQQDGFTPSAIQSDSILFGDRPYCGSIFITNSRYDYSDKKKYAMHSQISFGAIGPLAFGHEEQTAIHKAINDELPKGWPNQIQNDLILNYLFSFEKSLLYSSYFDMSISNQFRLGTMFTDAGTGITFRVGQKNRWYSLQQNKTLLLFAFAKADVKAVAYNATLQGGLLNRSSVYTISSQNIQRVIGNLEIGISSSYKNVQFNYSHTFSTKAFNTASTHAWGSLGCKINF